MNGGGNHRFQQLGVNNVIYKIYIRLVIYRGLAGDASPCCLQTLFALQVRSALFGTVYIRLIMRLFEEPQKKKAQGDKEEARRTEKPQYETFPPFTV